MKKPFPKFTSDDEAAAFVERADLTEYDLSGMKLTSFEFLPKSRSVTMRLPEALFEAIKGEAERSGVPYQRFIRKTLEAAIVLHERSVVRPHERQD